MKLFNPYLDLFRLISELPEDSQLQMRKKLIWAYSWAIPHDEAIERIAQFSPLLELGSGTGYWAWLIAQARGRIQCFDLEPRQPPRWFETQFGDSQIVSQSSEFTLFLCWPPLNTPMASQALAGYRGTHVLYVGEWRGRTADSHFHDQLEREWNLLERIPLPHWPGFSDDLFLFKRKLRDEAEEKD
jgi:hypothetical protein